MRRVFSGLLCSILLNLACTRTPVQTQPTWTEPDSSGVLRLVFRSGLAHGCPIGPTTLYTARHVAVRDRAGSAEPLQAIWSDRDGHEGSAWTTDYDFRRDLAVMESDTPFHTVYPLAGEPPAVGEKLIAVGFDYGDALAPKILTLTVRRRLSAHLVLSAGGEPGFSGSCLLNSRGEVAGIFHWKIQVGMASYGVGTLVTDRWQTVLWWPTGQKPN